MQKVIKDIEKNANNKIRISITEFKGNNYIDLRVYYEDDAGEYKPTKKGITFTPELISQVIESLQEAEKEMKTIKGQKEPILPATDKQAGVTEGE